MGAGSVSAVLAISVSLNIRCIIMLVRFVVSRVRGTRWRPLLSGYGSDSNVNPVMSVMRNMSTGSHELRCLYEG